MKTLNQWLALYGESHQNKTNQILHKICVPLIAWSTLSLIWIWPPILPIRAYFLLALLLGLFYYRLGKKPLMVFAAYIVVIHMINLILAKLGVPILYLALSIFVIAWVGQFIGHKIEGKKPSFFQDLQFLLIGPLWVARAIFNDSK